MELAGQIWKEGKHWLIEIPALDLMTQGYSKKEAIEMIKNAILELANHYFLIRKKIQVNDLKEGLISVFCSDSRLLLALSLRRQREKENLTVREISKRIGAKSPNAYAQYERGIINFSLNQYEKLMKAINPKQHCLIGLA